MRVTWCIVGAGITGVTLAERLAREFGQRVLLIDRRAHLGGNCYDAYDARGVLIHRYGPHIFRTSDRQVWTYLSSFTSWRPYYHRVRAVVDGQQIPLPFNLNSLHMLFPEDEARRATQRLLGAYGFGASVPILQLREQEDRVLRDLADFVYEKVYYRYTLKQWSCQPEALSPSVTARVPIVLNRDDRYFHDAYQAMPVHGYTAMFQRMLDHPKIHLMLNTAYRSVAEEIACDHLIYTGCLDEYFEGRHGLLPYRSLRFRDTPVEQSPQQPVATVNYPNEYDFTRTTEYKHLTAQPMPCSTVQAEYPEAYVPGENEPYYPIPRDEHEETAQHYRRAAAVLSPRIFFAGRLGEYRYYSMDAAVARALHLFQEEIAPCALASAP
jgi:UDP-galactopyranose mutase